jgi:ribonuclease P protein component
VKEFAIKENHLFVKAYSKGKRYVTDTVAVYVLKDIKAGRLRKENPEKQTLNRIGFSASTKLGGAVVRNRCKRIMREAYRTLIKDKPIRKGNLIVIVARSGAVGSTTERVKRDLGRAFAKLELYM